MARPLTRNAVIPVAGVASEGRQDTVAQLAVGAAVTFVPVDDNPHDPEAVEVRVADGQIIGYVPRSLAGRLRALHLGPSAGTVVELLGGGEGRSFGLRVAVTGEPVDLAAVERVVVSPTGRTMGAYVGEADGRIRVRDPQSAETFTVPADAVRVVAAELAAGDEADTTEPAVA